MGKIFALWVDFVLFAGSIWVLNAALTDSWEMGEWVGIGVGITLLLFSGFMLSKTIENWDQL